MQPAVASYLAAAVATAAAAAVAAAAGCSGPYWLWWHLSAPLWEMSNLADSDSG